MLLSDVKNPSYEKLFNQNESLKGNDSINMRCILSQRDNPVKFDTTTKNYLEFINSKMTVHELRPVESFEENIFDMKSLGNFLIKTETKFLPFSSQPITNEELNNLLNSSNKHLTLCFTWKAAIYDNGTFIRNAFGQHFVQIRHLFET